MIYNKLSRCILIALLPLIWPFVCDACLLNIFYVSEGGTLVPLSNTIASANAEMLLQFDPACQVKSVGVLLSLSDSLSFQCVPVQGNMATFEVKNTGDSYASAWFYMYQETTECLGTPSKTVSRDWEMNSAESPSCQVTAISLNLGNVRIYPNIFDGSALCLPWQSISLRAVTSDCENLDRVEIEWKSSTQSFVNDDTLSVFLSEEGRVQVKATPFFVGNNTTGTSKTTTFRLEDCFKMWRNPLPTPPTPTVTQAPGPTTQSPTPSRVFTDFGRPTGTPFSQRTPPPVPMITREPKPPISTELPTPKPTRIPKPPIAISSPTPAPVFTDFGRPTDAPFSQRTPPPFPVATRPPKPPITTELPTPKPTRIPKPPLPATLPTPSPVFTDFARPTATPEFRIAGEETTPQPNFVPSHPTKPPRTSAAPSEPPTTGFTLA